MNDGSGIPAEEAGAWLRENFKDDPEPKIDIAWTVSDQHDPGRVHQLLEFLFTPQTDDNAA